MSNDFYNTSGAPTTHSTGTSATIRSEFTSIAAGFDKMPPLTARPLYLVRVNAGGTALESIDPTTYVTAILASATYLPLAGGTLTGNLIMSGTTKIGTGGVTPAVAVHVKSTGENLRIETTAARGSGSNYVSFFDPSGVKGYLGYTSGVADNYVLMQGLNAPMVFYTNATVRAQIDGSGVATFYGELDAAPASGASYVASKAVAGQTATVSICGNGAATGVSSFDIQQDTVSSYVWCRALQAILFGTNNTERMRISATGLVGINCTATAAPLRVQEAANNDVGFEWQRSSSTTGRLLSYNRASSAYTNLVYDALSHEFRNSGGTSGVFIDSSANVGIGGASTGSPLYVTGSSTGQLVNLNSTSANGGYIAWMLSGSAKGYMGSAAQLLSGGSNADLAIRAEAVFALSTGGSTERLRVDASGNLIVGATSRSGIGSGSDLFTVNGGISFTTQLNGYNASYIELVNRAAGGFKLYTNLGGVVALTVSAAGVLTDLNGNELGYKGMPTASVTSGAFVAADRGKIVYASGGVTIPNSTMSQGDVVTIFNNTAGNITITASVGTLYLAGTALTGNRTLAQRGLCTVEFISSTVAVISGAGLS